LLIGLVSRYWEEWVGLVGRFVAEWNDINGEGRRYEWRSENEVVLRHRFGGSIGAADGERRSWRLYGRRRGKLE